MQSPLTGMPDAPAQPPSVRHFFMRKRAFLSGCIAGLACGILIAAISPPLHDICYRAILSTNPFAEGAVIPDTSITKAAKIQRQIDDLGRQLRRLVPQDPYFVVCTSDNNFELRQGDKVLRKGSCSTGSYVLLKSRDAKQRWIFETPRGMYRILQKDENPVWHRPDWAFIEEGKSVPPTGSPERDEYGVLGDYAMALGHGYLIHGTLYQRFLGMPVTHGCVRLGDEDLEAAYQNLAIGSKVFIY